MNQARLLGILLLWFGMLVIVQSAVLNGFTGGFGSLLSLGVGLVLALAGLYGAMYVEGPETESIHPFVYLILVGVLLYTLATVAEIAF